MKQVVAVILLALGAAVVWPGVAFAQEPEPISVGKLFVWATGQSPDWARGAFLAGLGLVGALVTILGLVGGAVPGTAGQARIDADMARLDQLSQRLTDLANAAPPDAAAIAAIEPLVNNLRDDIRVERWRQFFVAAGLYAILGAFFATLLAQDILQALVIGSGWTAVLGTIGLKKDYSVRKEQKDAALEEAQARARVLQTTPADLLPQSAGLAPTHDFEQRVYVAKSL